MKKWISTVLSGAMILSLACSGTAVVSATDVVAGDDEAIIHVSDFVGSAYSKKQTTQSQMTGSNIERSSQVFKVGDVVNVTVQYQVTSQSGVSGFLGHTFINQTSKDTASTKAFAEYTEDSSEVVRLSNYYYAEDGEETKYIVNHTNSLFETIPEGVFRLTDDSSDYINNEDSLFMDRVSYMGIVSNKGMDFSETTKAVTFTVEVVNPGETYLYSVLEDMTDNSSSASSITENAIISTSLEKVGTVRKSSLTLDKTELTLNMGETYTLTGTVTPSDSTVTYRWISSDTKVAGVSSAGKIIPRASGTTTIKCKASNGLEATCQVTVKAVPQSVTLDKTELTLVLGQNYTLTSTVTPSDAVTTYKWFSSDTKVAGVSSTGKIISRAVGTTTIKCKTDNGKTATCAVTVKSAPTSVALDKTELTLALGESYTLTGIVTPSDALTTYKWFSSDTKVAGVSSTGKIIPRAVGTTTIKCKTDNGKTATCTVTVKSAPTGVALDKTELTLALGQTYTLTGILTPADSFTTYKWFSSDTKVAGVSSTGKIIPRAVGTTVIKCKTSNGKTATCTVTITAK